MTSPIKCFIGLAQWNHPEWDAHLHAHATGAGNLFSYAKALSSVEGNHTFYGLPNHEQIKNWAKETPVHFKFCFKFPKEISHERSLLECEKPLERFLDCMSSIEEKIGVLCLQLPEHFNSDQLESLHDFLSLLPSQFNYSVEVRHPSFFNKADSEKLFNRCLKELNINRTLFDTRALFSLKAYDEATLDAQRKKPRVPLHVIATSETPVVRIITAMDWQASWSIIEPWIAKLANWMNEGKTPFVFLHTPNNSEAPLLAQQFAQILQTKTPHKVGFSPWVKAHTQAGLF